MPKPTQEEIDGALENTDEFGEDMSNEVIPAAAYRAKCEDLDEASNTAWVNFDFFQEVSSYLIGKLGDKFTTEGTAAQNVIKAIQAFEAKAEMLERQYAELVFAAGECMSSDDWNDLMEPTIQRHTAEREALI